MRKLAVSLLVSFACFAATSAYATTAINISNTTGQTLANPPFTLGWSFTTSSAITVNQLGFFDDSLNGLVDSHQIGIFDSAGNLIVSATVQSGTVDPLINQFRYVSIAPTLLMAGQMYEIGALYLDGNDPLIFPGNSQGFSTGPGINYLDATFAGGGTLTAPLNVGGTDGYFGPNFTYGPVVPEPGSLFLLGSGLLGLAGVARRKLNV